MKPVEAAIAFLQTLYPTGTTGYLNIHDAVRRSEWFNVTDLPAAAAYALQRNQDGYDVWYMTGLSATDLGSAHKGREDQIIALPTLHCDIDILNPEAHKTTALPPTFDDAHELLRAYPLKPTMIVNSGHGLQAYWVFERPVPITADNRMAVKQLSKDSQAVANRAATARGWKVDGTANLDRILRIPGTANLKGKAVGVDIHFFDGPRYSFEQLRAAIPTTAPVPPPAASAPQAAAPIAPSMAESPIAPPTGTSPAATPEDGGIETTPKAVTASTWTDAEILERIGTAANGAKFREVWRGDLMAYGNNRSDAIEGLLCMLAFYTRDPAQLQRLAAQATVCLGYEKCTRDDWWNTSIAKALQHVKTFHRDANPVPASTTTSSSTSTSGPDCLPTSDLGNARRLVRDHGNDIRFVPGTGWHVWTGTHWEADTTGEVMRLAKSTVQNIHQEYEPCRRIDRQKEILKWALSSESAAKLEAMLKVTETESAVVVRPETLDANQFAFNCTNGTIDLRSGMLCPHNRTDLLTKVSPVVFDPEAKCPTFDAFLNRIFTDNQPLIAYVLAVLGHCMTGDISLEHLWVLYGSGANGKSTLLSIVSFILGAYYSSAPDSLLTIGREEHPTELADLQGKRLVAASETENNARLRLQLVKKLTGEPTIKARRMRMDFYEFPRTHKTLMMTNNKPIISENTEAAWRRIRLIPFTVQIAPAERDPQLGAKLKAEASGILNRLVAGCLTWQRDGLVDPDEVKNATNAYREESNFTGRFVDDRCMTAKNAWVSTRDLYQAYSQYCEQNGERFLTTTKFGNELVKLGYVAKRNNKGARGWAGLNLVTNGDNEATWNSDADAKL